MKSPTPDHIPVIIGVGEVTDRPASPMEGLEPLALMELALRRASEDAGGDLLPKVDSLTIVNEVSWPYLDAPTQLSQRLAIEPTHSHYGEIGGESPVRFIHEAALQIARGECRVAAVVGAEATHTVAKATKLSQSLPWTERHPEPKLVRGMDLVHPLSLRHGIFSPITIYPLYENASLAAWGQTPAEALDESGRLWQRYAEVAVENSYAWTREPLSPEQIVTPATNNRLIAWPYTKHMVANPMVNQGAAILLTSLANARALGIQPERMVFVLGGAAAREPQDYLQREQFERSDAQNAVLETVLAMAGGDAQVFSELELYSCFPCVPKMARRTLGLDESFTPTVAGGLSFFGAPLNNYMTHAAAAMVRRLRGQDNGLGLLYGQGEFVTKHHALLLGTVQAGEPLAQEYSVQEKVESRRGPVPELIEKYSGTATLETFTLSYDRNGVASSGFVIARTPQGQRVLARVPADDMGTLSALTSSHHSPVGMRGCVGAGPDELLQWSVEA